MGFDKWLRVADTIGTLAGAGSRLARTGAADAGGARTPGALETRLAGVLVAALKEAFDRDKARMDLERDTVEAERSRAERALQAELRRQAADRTLTQLRLIAIFGGCLLLASLALAAFVAGMRDGYAALALATGWGAGLATLGCVFAAWPQVSAWAASTGAQPQHSSTAVAAPWLLLASVALVAASLLIAS